MILVIDTSVAVQWFLNEPGHRQARALLIAENQLVAPDFVVAEVANVLWRRQRTGGIQPTLVDEALNELPNFFDRLAPAADLVLGALQLARALEHSVYDCMFLHLAADIEGSVMVTSDRRFAEKVARSSYAKLLQPLSGLAVRKEN